MGAVQVLAAYALFVLGGLWFNVAIAASAFLAGFAASAALTALSLASPSAAKLALALSRVVRGLPPLVLLAATYWLAMPLLGLPRDALLACVLAFALRTTAFQVQILRSAVEAVERGQLEAALSLGLSEREAAFRVLIPQALRLSLPALANEFSSLLKESTLGLALGVLDALARARYVSVSTGYSLVWVLAAGLMVYALSAAVLWASRAVQRKLALPGTLGAGVSGLWR